MKTSIKFKKFISFFYEKIDNTTVSKWWHGYCYTDYICRKKYCTVIIPLNLIFAILRAIYFDVRMAGFRAEEFYFLQRNLREKKKVEKDAVVRGQGIYYLGTDGLRHVDPKDYWLTEYCQKPGCKNTVYHDHKIYCYPHSRWYRPFTRHINGFISWLEDCWENLPRKVKQFFCKHKLVAVVTEYGRLGYPKTYSKCNDCFKIMNAPASLSGNINRDSNEFWKNNEIKKEWFAVDPAKPGSDETVYRKTK